MKGLAVSAILALDEFETGTAAIDALRSQTIADRTELVVAGPDLDVPAAAADGFAALTNVSVPIQPLSAARAAGILASRGRTVYVAETHGLPRPDCLELLHGEIESGAAAAMPRLVNANPGTARSWASLFATYGSFTGSASRRLSAVALHNAAFDRAALAEVAADPVRLVYGVGISRAVSERGLEMRFCPAAAVEHLNVVRPGGILADRLIGGRLWAGMRSASWPLGRRLAHAIGTPLAPLVMTTRIMRSDGWRELAATAPRGTGTLVAAFAAMQALGELVGYVAGPGPAERQHLDLELHREDYL